MKKIFSGAPALLLLLAVFTSCSSSQTETKTETQVAEVYQCPMDCEEGKTYDKPGTCPACGMDLEKVEKE